MPDVLILSETWFTQDNPRDLNGYIAQYVPRGNGRGEGLSVFVNDNNNSFLHPEVYFISI